MATISRSTTTVSRTTQGTPVTTVTQSGPVTTVTKTTRLVPAYRYGPARGWLKTLGWTSIVLGILGLVALVVDYAHDYAFHLEGGQMLFHWVLGIACLVAAYALRTNLWLGVASLTAGAILIGAGLLGFVMADWHAGATDNVLHLLLGLASVLVGIVTINRERDATSRRPAVVPPA